MVTIPTALQRLAIIISYIVASLSICSWRPNSRPKRGPSRFFRAEFMKQSFAGSGRSSRLAMQFFSRELSARDSLVEFLYLRPSVWRPVSAVCPPARCLEASPELEMVGVRGCVVLLRRHGHLS